MFSSRHLPPHGVPHRGREVAGGDGLAGRPRGDPRIRRQQRLHLHRLEPGAGERERELVTAR